MLLSDCWLLRPGQTLGRSHHGGWDHVPGRCPLQTCLLLASLKCIRTHQAIRAPEDRVGSDEIIDPRAGLVAAEAAIGFKEETNLGWAHPPFDDGSGQVPGDVRGTGVEMIVAMAAAIALQNLAIARMQPFVGMHAAVGDHRAFELEPAFSKILSRDRPAGDPIVGSKAMVPAAWRNTKAGSRRFFLAVQDFFSVVAEPDKLEQPALPTARSEIFQALETNP